jgi:hypothetical protein
MTGGDIVLLIVGIGVTAQVLDVIFKKIGITQIDPADAAGEHLMNQRLSVSGRRVGAVLDAVDSQARGKKPTNWR